MQNCYLCKSNSLKCSMWVMLFMLESQLCMTKYKFFILINGKQLSTAVEMCLWYSVRVTDWFNVNGHKYCYEKLVFQLTGYPFKWTCRWGYPHWMIMSMWWKTWMNMVLCKVKMQHNHHPGKKDATWWVWGSSGESETHKTLEFCHLLKLRPELWLDFQEYVNWRGVLAYLTS